MDALVIMAREPKPNEVKTRLTPKLSPETAAKLYYNFLLDRIDQVRGIDGLQPFVAFTPNSSKEFFTELIPPGFELIPQTGSDLGERLTNISTGLFNRGFNKVVIMDSDSPNLPTRFIKEAFERLDSQKVVLGSCNDGGYYLIGLGSNIPEMFKDIPWSTSKVTYITLSRAAEHGVKIAMLDNWYDIDTYDDLLQLKEDLDSNSKIGAFNCKYTYNILNEIL